MTSRLRALERLLACQRAQVIVTPIAEDFVEAWEHAIYEDLPLPDTLDLLQAIVAARVLPLAAGAVANYVDYCRLDHDVPVLERIVEAIVHGFARSRLLPGRRCRCLIPRTISWT